MTSRCYFGKMNSILGSVVPLAMFDIVVVVITDQALAQNQESQLRRIWEIATVGWWVTCFRCKGYLDIISVVEGWDGVD